MAEEESQDPPRYTQGGTKFTESIKQHRERLDSIDMRSELAALQALANQLVRGLNPIWYRQRMLVCMKGLERHLRQAKAQEGPQMSPEAVVKELQRVLEDRTCDPVVFMDLVKEIRSTAKILLDMEVTMKKALPAERVRAMIQAVMGVVKRRVTADQMQGISEDLQDLKRRGTV